MSKHTPGPWSSSKRDDAVFVPLKSIDCERIGFCICFVNTDNKSINDEAKANARLIAAAPELLEAADNALNTLIACCVSAGGVDDRRTILEAQQMLRAAIAKATGVEP